MPSDAPVTGQRKENPYPFSQYAQSEGGVPVHGINLPSRDRTSRRDRELTPVGEAADLRSENLRLKAELSRLQGDYHLQKEMTREAEQKASEESFRKMQALQVLAEKELHLRTLVHELTAKQKQLEIMTTKYNDVVQRLYDVHKKTEEMRAVFDAPYPVYPSVDDWGAP